MKAYKYLINAIVILSLLLLVACSNETTKTTDENKNNSSAEKSNDKTLFIGVTNAPILLNPINTADTTSTWLVSFMFGSLLEMDGPLSFVPVLADSFETTDNQTFTIKLNEKANWTDGKPVTAEDVAFTFNLIANPKVETTDGAYIASLDGLGENGKLPEGQTELSSVKIIDEKTIEIKTKQPFDANMIKEQIGTKIQVLPKHVLKDVDPAKLSQHPFMQKPNVSNGPFQFVQYKKDQYVELAGNPDYYFGKPELEKIFVKIMPGPNLVAQLQTGGIHMNTPLIGNIAIQDYETVKGLANVRTKNEGSVAFQTMIMNNETIKDSKLRKAIAYAVDRQLIVDKLLKGYGDVIDGPYTPVSPFLNKDLKQFSYDTEKAKQLIKESGWDVNKPLRLVVPIGNKVREQSASIIEQNLQEAGLKVEVTTYDFPTVTQKAKAGDFDLLLYGLKFTLDPDVTTLYGSKGTYNYMNYDNPKSDELLEKGKNETDPDKRKVIYNELQEIWNEDMPILTLYSDHEFSAISNDVVVGEPKAIGYHYNIHQWSVGGGH
ncbi:ABC transporter substrate-binding protein [Peribacillus butanolivorans]|uniref:ABC transporter substrate-binding protein n=1 Tax=Peribacillus butanolivorans TaxID=421767 RepID=UPI0030C93D70